MEEFKEKGLIKQCHESDSMFETLSSAFMDDPDVVHKKIEKALLKSPKYKTFDTNAWITRPLSNRWDPLVFYICANEYQRVISIQVDETQEYRIFPDETPRFPSVRCLQIEQFKYVHWPDCLGAIDETEEHNDEKDYKASKDYLENQLEKIKIFFDPKEAEKIKTNESCLDEDHLIKENMDMVDKTLSFVQHQEKEIAKRDQTIDETVEEFDNAVNMLKKRLKSIKSQPNTTIKQPNYEPYRQTDTSSPEKYVDPHDIIPNQEPQSQTGSFNSQLDVHDNHGKYKQHSQTSLTAHPEANKRRPVDDKTQRQIKSPPDQNEQRNSEQQIRAGVCNTKIGTLPKEQKKKKGSMILRLSQEKNTGSDASYSPEPRIRTPARRSKSPTTFTSHR